MRGSRAFIGEAFARAAGISPKTLRRVERNRGPVTVSTARKIGAVLGIDDPRSLGRVVGRA
jgi:transcriptional regulator with XRE-family HTH domain